MTEEQPPQASPTPAGWYPDPQAPGSQRYWDGATWTEHRHPPAGPRLPLKKSNDLALGGFIAGCVGIFFGVIPFTWFIAIPCGIGALVCCILGYRNANADPSLKHKDLAAWGIGLGGVAVVFGIIGVIILSVLINSIEPEEVDRAADAIEESIDDLERQAERESNQP